MKWFPWDPTSDCYKRDIPRKSCLLLHHDNTACCNGYYYIMTTRRAAMGIITSWQHGVLQWVFSGLKIYHKPTHGYCTLIPDSNDPFLYIKQRRERALHWNVLPTNAYTTMELFCGEIYNTLQQSLQVMAYWALWRACTITSKVVYTYTYFRLFRHFFANIAGLSQGSRTPLLLYITHRHQD